MANSYSFTRAQLSGFIPDPQTLKAFEQFLLALNTEIPQESSNVDSSSISSYSAASEALEVSRSNEDALNNLLAMPQQMDNHTDIQPLLDRISALEAINSSMGVIMSRVDEINARLEYLEGSV